MNARATELGGRWLRWAAALGLAAALAACGGGGSEAPRREAASVRIVQSGLLLEPAGASQGLQVEVLDAEGTPIDDAAITWSSSRPEQVEVDAAGRVSARGAAGTAQIVARAGAVQSPPLVVLVATPAAGVRVLDDAQLIGDVVETDPDAAPTIDNTYRIELAAGVELPAAGARLLGRGSIPVAGEVVAVDVATRRVTLRFVPLRELLPDLTVDETFALSDAPWEIPQAIRDAYDITRVGDRVDFAPRPGAFPTTAARERPQAAGAAGTAALPVFPFDSCESTLTGVSAGGDPAPLPLAFAIPPAFSMSLPASLRVLHTPAEGLKELKLIGKPTFSISAGLKLTAAIDGTMSCKVTLTEIPVPVGGVLSWLAGAYVPVGVGVELGGRVTLATMEVGMVTTATGDMEMGFDCRPDDCDFTFQPLRNVHNTIEPKLDLPTVGDFRVELSGGLFGFADLKLGVAPRSAILPGAVRRLLRSLSIEAANSRLTGKLATSVAPRLTQVSDPAYASNYQLTLEAKAGLGSELGDLAKLLGVASVNGLEVTLPLDLAVSPTGNLSADRSSYAPGDAVRFTARLDNVHQIFGGAYNVARVLLVRAVPGGTQVVDHIDASDGQREFVFTHTATDVGRADEFYAFVTTKAFDFTLPEQLEIFPFEIARAVPTATDPPPPVSGTQRWAGSVDYEVVFRDARSDVPGYSMIAGSTGLYSGAFISGDYTHERKLVLNSTIDTRTSPSTGAVTGSYSESMVGNQVDMITLGPVGTVPACNNVKLDSRATVTVSATPVASHPGGVLFSGSAFTLYPPTYTASGTENVVYAQSLTHTEPCNPYWGSGPLPGSAWSSAFTLGVMLQFPAVATNLLPIGGALSGTATQTWDLSLTTTPSEMRKYYGASGNVTVTVTYDLTAVN